MELNNSFLGRGWSFPPAFVRGAGVKMLDAEDDIRSSLQVLLATRIGERVMQPEYGCNMDDMVFEAMTTSFQTFMKNQIEKAILSGEPRIDLQNVDLQTQNAVGGVILIIVDYVVRATNTRTNLVYPFYKTEANLIG
jgi:phage baseplate assembly protein W